MKSILASIFTLHLFVSLYLISLLNILVFFNVLLCWFIMYVTLFLITLFFHLLLFLIIITFIIRKCLSCSASSFQIMSFTAILRLLLFLLLLLLFFLLFLLSIITIILVTSSQKNFSTYVLTRVCKGYFSLPKEVYFWRVEMIVDAVVEDRPSFQLKPSLFSPTHQPSSILLFFMYRSPRGKLPPSLSF